MKVLVRSLRSLFLLLIIFLGACAPQSTPATTLSDLTAKLSEVEGDVQAHLTAQGQFAPAGNGLVLQVNGQVRTGEGGRARLDLSTGTLVRVSPTSLFTLKSNQPVPGGLETRFSLDFGQMWIILNGGSTEVETPSGVASVRGSYMMVEVLADGGVQVTCLEGHCQLRNQAGTVNLTDGEKAVILNAGSPPVASEMTEQDVLDWLDNNPEAILVIPQEGEHPISRLLADFFGVPYDVIDEMHTDGNGFGVIAQSCWASYRLAGDASLCQDIAAAKKSGDYSAFEMPDGSIPTNWGQFLRTVKQQRSVLETLGAINSGRAGQQVGQVEPPDKKNNHPNNGRGPDPEKKPDHPDTPNTPNNKK